MRLQSLPWEGETPGPPVSLAEVKAHARVTHGAEDDLLENTILEAALQWAETGTRRSVRLQRWELLLDRFPSSRRLPILRPPLVSIASVEYRETGGGWVEIDLADFEVDRSSEPGLLLPRYGAGWPWRPLGRVDALRVRFTAGYRPAVGYPVEGFGVAPRISPILRAAILNYTTHAYENRTADAPPAGAERLLWSERVDL